MKEQHYKMFMRFTQNPKIVSSGLGNHVKPRCNIYAIIRERRSKAFCGIVEQTTKQQKTNCTLKRRKKIMARERMVTRTVTETKVDVMVVNTETCEVSIRNYGLTYQPDEKSALKYVQKRFDSELEKHVAIQGFRNEETLYGMTEQEFIQLAKVLPPRTKVETEEN